MRKILPALAAVALAFPLMAVSPAHAEDPTDFVRQANQINLQEIELGHYAADHGVGREVREYGAMLADDHSSASDELHRVANHYDMHLRDHLDSDHRAKVDEIESKHGMEFDRAFIHEMIDGHRHAIGLFEDAAHGHEHREVRDYAQSQLPGLHHHLDRAQEIAEHLHWHW